MKAKLIKIEKEWEKKVVNGKDVFPMKADVEIDGEKKNINVSAWGPDALEAFKRGDLLDIKDREFNGTIYYTVFADKAGGSAPAGKPSYKPGFSGGKSFDPEAERVKQRGIMLENCLTNMVALAVTVAEASTVDAVIANTVKTFRALWAEANEK
jgi:hypothetical protein